MIMNEKFKDLVETEIMNFIDFWTSNDEERDKMNDTLKTFMEEYFEYEPERINELEEKAWLNITGEEVENSLDEKDREEYIKLYSGEEFLNKNPEKYLVDN